MPPNDASLNQDQGRSLWVVNSILISLATLAVIGRFYARKLRKLAFGADDWTILIALLLLWALYGLFVACRQYGLGKHRAALPEDHIPKFLDLLYYFQIVYILAPPTVKLSLLFLYRRIFVSTKFITIVYVVGAVVSLWAIIMTFLGIFNCTPIHAFWTGQGKCLPFKQFAIGYAVVNIITDLAVWLMPIPMMWKLQLPLGRKVALTLIFALGLFDCASALIRLNLSMLALGNWDVTYDYARGFMWSIIEVSVGIVCTCLPTMRIILKSAFNGHIGRFLRFSSLTPNRQSSGSKPWLRSTEYNEIQPSWLIRDGGSHQNHSNVTTSTTVDRDELRHSSHGIQVLEEVKIELQQIEPARVTNKT
ncbi:uncharacterized protein ATNIH1004_004325 [Aspergillus tanneri]|uniref:Rhodopsin domain-containing protein n=1 Tax=Aspergillus tanneri TaxID=1220188 RepID=A0A5M9MSW5_9EURO|nr:uncharacterized protein ATNIH1004_004325 [Aspergillus tanneri]KAA8648440.1 hypothetical protein ATNIH1004_004325 [Aspergillus tanneri]